MFNVCEKIKAKKNIHKLKKKVIKIIQHKNNI